MTRTELEQEVMSLPIEERLELAEAIWQRLEQEPAQPVLPAWQQELLDERIAEDDADPDAGSPWEEVKRRILSTL
jgi:putative addiction module component (TIGR02574 family)